MKNQWRVILGLVLVLIVVIFAVLNNQAVPVNFGFTKISGPLILIILGSAIIGALVGLLTSTTTIWNQRKELKAVQKELVIYKNDMDKLVKEETEKFNVLLIINWLICKSNKRQHHKSQNQWSTNKHQTQK